MKFLYFFTLSILLLTSNGLIAQCTGCTTTISTATSTPQVVNAGQKLCITASGDLSGLLLVNGGEVCNEGTISSASIALTGGSIDNLGTMDNNELGITDGTFTNGGVANIDSLAMEGASITVMNMGVLNSIAISQSVSGSGGIPALHNMAPATLTCDSIGVLGGEVHNHGSFTVNYDLGNYAPALFENHCTLTVGRHYGNTGTFMTEKMITVGGDFGNSGTITGPTIGCGGFSVTGGSLNSGDYGVDGSNLDICDGGSGSFDANTGSLGSGVTICTCTDVCAVGISEIAHVALSVYPNPVNGFFTVSFDEVQSDITVRLMDSQGKLVWSVADQTVSSLRIDREGLDSGLYFLSVHQNGQIIAAEKIVLE